MSSRRSPMQEVIEHLMSQGMTEEEATEMAVWIRELSRRDQEWHEAEKSGGASNVRAGIAHRAREIAALCRMSGKPQYINSFVAAGLTRHEAQRRLREVCGDAGPFVRAPQPRAALKGNPVFDAMARARFGKRATQ